jgi:hypothetical protein
MWQLVTVSQSKILTLRTADSNANSVQPEKDRRNKGWRWVGFEGFEGSQKIQRERERCEEYGDTDANDYDDYDDGS